MEWAKHEKDLERIARQGIEVEALKNRPEIPPWLFIVWKAFLDLHQTRGPSDGFTGDPKPIYPERVAAWFEIHGIVGDERTEFADYILALDDVWIGKIRGKLLEQKEVETKNADAVPRDRRPKRQTRGA